LTIDACRKLSQIYVSEEVSENIKAIEEALDEECDGLDVLTTESTPHMIRFWESCLSQADDSFRENDYQEAFITLLALTVTMFKLDHWMLDNEDLETVVSVMGQLSAAWKNCLTKSFEELGVHGEKSRLIKWLDNNAESVKLVNPQVPDFKWILE